MLLYSAWAWEALKRLQRSMYFGDEAGGHSKCIVYTIRAAAIDTNNLQWYLRDTGSL